MTMRLLLPFLAAACTLLASCSNDGLAKSQGFANKGIASIKNTFTRDQIGGYTRADIANLRMRDLNPLAKTPPIVQVQQSTLREMPKERVAFFKKFSWFSRKPVDYNPPTLPDGALAFDGGLLPAKNGSNATARNTNGELSGTALASAENEDGQEFSIE